MAKPIQPVFDLGQKFVVSNGDSTHVFRLNEIVSYKGSVKKLDGLIYHLMQGEADGRVDYLVDGEFEALPRVKKVGIALHGCDDSTMFNKELNDEQIAFLKEIVEITQKVSQSSCQPRLEVSDTPFELYEDENE